jgi:CheY-like chemotaxis protein
MPRVLVIDPDRTALAAMQAALEQSGFNDVLALTSGSFALTMLERNRPDLIMSRVSVPDIDGYELCSIVRKDPLMTDQTLAGDLPLTAIVSEVVTLLKGGAQTPVATSEPPATQPDGAHGLRGSLAVMELPDITQAIALGSKTGQLVVTLPSGRGAVFFDRGKVVHAEFFGLIGETAFAALLVAAHGEASGNFAFNPLEATAVKGAKTIHRDLKQLLLSAAAEIDEGRADAAVAPIS